MSVDYIDGDLSIDDLSDLSEVREIVNEQWTVCGQLLDIFRCDPMGRLWRCRPLFSVVGRFVS